MTTYNGYKNYQTWNLALWASNEYSIYKRLTAFKNRESIIRCLEREIAFEYSSFVKGFLNDCEHLNLSKKELIRTIDFNEVADSFLED